MQHNSPIPLEANFFKIRALQAQSPDAPAALLHSRFGACLPRGSNLSPDWQKEEYSFLVSLVVPAQLPHRITGKVVPSIISVGNMHTYNTLGFLAMAVA
jgi:hypothetical protein